MKVRLSKRPRANTHALPAKADLHQGGLLRKSRLKSVGRSILDSSHNWGVTHEV